MIRKVFFSLLCAAVLVGARELNVSENGNDANSGTADAPLASIAKAAKLAQPGDTVKIGPGIFREQVTINEKAGREDAPIVFEGTRDEKGEYLTIVEPDATNFTEWAPAPEMGPKVWKVATAHRPDLVMMDGATIALVNSQTSKLPPWNEIPKVIDEGMIWSKFGPKCKRLPGLDYLKLSEDTIFKHRYFGKEGSPFWPMIGHVLAVWNGGFLYLRFANEDKPENHVFTGANGDGFVIDKASYITFRNLHVRGSYKQFHIKNQASHISIENCLLMHGRYRINVEADASFTTIRGNIMTSGFLNSELFGMRSKKDWRGGLLYEIFKYVIGTSTSNDSGIMDYGKNTRILDNILVQGLIGMDAYGVNTEVAGNVVRKMSSVGICTGATTVGTVHDNLVMHCGIPLRLHNIRGKRTKREEYHYRNLFVQDYDEGQQIFIHCQSNLTKDDGVNFEPDGTYKQNPPNPVDAGKIYIYHNTFWGGAEAGGGPFNVVYLSKRFRMVMPFFLINNIYKDSYRMSVTSHELVGPNLLYAFEKDIPLETRREKDVVKFNKMVNTKDSQNLWNKNEVEGLPDVTLASNSPALDSAVDISRTFTVNGKEYQALPGFQSGYFKGKAPAFGALQEGESMEHFVEMHRRANEAIKMLNRLKERTAAEARRKVSVR